jgi:hypothetical protein
MFFVFTVLAEWRPGPIDPGGTRLVSLAFVFIIASRLIFGREWSVLIGAGAIGLAMAAGRSEPLKVAFNVATYAVAGALSSLALLAAPPTSHGYGSLALCVVLSWAVFIRVNVLMVCIAMGLAREVPVLPIFMDHLRQSGPSSDHDLRLGAGGDLLARLPPLVLLLGAPLVALTLYPALGRPSPGRGGGRLDGQPDRAQEPARSRRTRPLLRHDVAQRDDGRAVPHRHRPLQAGQRPARASGRRRDPRGAGPGDRGDDPGAATASAATSTACCSRASGPTRSTRSPTCSGRSRSCTTSCRDRAGHDQRRHRRVPFHADDLPRRRSAPTWRSTRASSTDATARRPTPVPGESDSRDFLSLPFPMATIRLVTARAGALVDAFSDASAERRASWPRTATRVCSTGGAASTATTQAVARLAVRAGAAARRRRRGLENIHLAALLHDIGKIAVPRAHPQQGRPADRGRAGSWSSATR